MRSPLELEALCTSQLGITTKNLHAADRSSERVKFAPVCYIPFNALRIHEKMRIHLSIRHITLEIEIRQFVYCLLFNYDRFILFHEFSEITLVAKKPCVRDRN